MRHLFILLTLLISISFSQAQEKELLIISSEKGQIKIQPILHSTMAIYFDGKVIYTDPYGGKEIFANVPDPDLILITDIHGDHMDVNTLQALNVENIPIIAPQAVADKIAEQFKSISVLANGESTKRAGIDVEAVPMYNLPEDADSRHTKGRGNGYILNLGGKRLYVSGDTEDIPEMRSLKNIDVAFVCMNQPYTMTVDAAANAVLEFKPKIVFPFHYRGQGGFSDVKKFKQLVMDVNSKIDVRLVNWYPEK